MKFSKDYAAIITAVYQKYNPEKIKDVHSLLEKYATREEELLERIFTKYQLPKAERIQFYNEIHEFDSSTDTPRYAQFQIKNRLHEQSTSRWTYGFIFLLILISLVATIYVFSKKESGYNGQATENTAPDERQGQKRILNWILYSSGHQLYLNNILPAAGIRLSKIIVFVIHDADELEMEEKGYVNGTLASLENMRFQVKDNKLLLKKRITRSELTGTERETDFSWWSDVYIKLPAPNQTKNWSYVSGDEKYVCLSYFDEQNNLIVQRDVRDNKTGEHYVRTVEYYEEGTGMFRIDQIDPKTGKTVMQYMAENSR